MKQTVDHFTCQPYNLILSKWVVHAHKKLQAMWAFAIELKDPRD